MAFKEISIESLNFNPFEKISKEWMLITAGAVSYTHLDVYKRQESHWQQWECFPQLQLLLR